jgi:hypothetical protein
MFGCQQIRINPDKELQTILEFICQEANKLHNCAVYYARQIYFKAKRCVKAFDLNNELKQNPHYCMSSMGLQPFSHQSATNCRVGIAHKALLL